jgi:hypothetical protein
MNLVVIYGPPASGKLTVAQELSAITGYKLFHNHLTVNAVAALFEFGSAEFMRLLRHIPLALLSEAVLVDGLDVRVLSEAGELLRRLTLDPSKDYQGTGAPPGPPKGRYVGKKYPKTSTMP